LIGEAYLEPDAPAYFMTYSQLNFLMAEAAERGYISGGSAMAATYYLEGIAASYEANGISSAGLSAPYSGGNAGLRQIAEQEWVALYMQGYEAWAEYRRTGYPDLPLAIDAEENRIPTRFNYPTNEQSLNNESYTAAVNDQGPDTLTNPTCWQ